MRVFPLMNQEQDKTTLNENDVWGGQFPVRANDLPAHIAHIQDDSPVWRIGSASVRRIALNHPGGSQGSRIKATVAAEGLLKV